MRPIPSSTPGGRSRTARALRGVQWTLLVGGLGLLTAYAAARLHGMLGRAHALETFAAAESMATESASDSPAVAERDPLAEVGEPDQSLWDKARIAAYERSATASQAPPIGVLSIPAIDLRVPIFDGTSEVALNRGAGRIEGTADIDAVGNLGLAGHRDGFFRGLKDIERADVIDIQTRGGTRHYRVTDTFIVDPTDVHVLDATDHATLTLVTCYPFYFVGEAPKRYIVKAVQIAAR